MQNKYIIVLFLAFGVQAKAQMIEAESRPYRFDIDKSLEYEDVSPPMAFNIIPTKVLIRDRIETEVSKWYGKEGYKYGDTEEFEILIKEKITEIQPAVFQEVGMNLFEHTRPEWFFLQGSLEFEIRMNGFKAFLIGIPLNEVESFKLHFDKLEFSKQKFTYSEEGQFVITYIQIFNPDNGRKYIFYNTAEESIVAPSFSISFSDLDR